jgi:hypothetical protein
VAGCQLLFPGFVPPDASGAFPEPSPIASFQSGRATIKLDGGETIELTELHGTADLNTLFGARISWENESGWYLRLIGGGNSGGPEAEFPPTLMIDRIVDDEHWTTRDDRCVVDLDKADKTGVKGSATCKRLRWHDALAGYEFNGNDLVPDQPKFDATITFEALPQTEGLAPLIHR